MGFWEYDRTRHARNVWEECKAEERKMKAAKSGKGGGSTPTYQMELSPDFGPQFIPPPGRPE